MWREQKNSVIGLLMKKENSIVAYKFGFQNLYIPMPSINHDVTYKKIKELKKMAYGYSNPGLFKLLAKHLWTE